MKTTTENKKQSISKVINLSDVLVQSNTRNVIEDEALIELSTAIDKHGLLQAIGLNFINGVYQIVYGHRRYFASLLLQKLNAKKNTINALVYCDLKPDEVLELQIIENLHRTDLHPMDEARAYKKLIDVNKYDAYEISLRIAKSVSFVVQRLKLNDLFIEFEKAFLNNRFNLTTALLICKISLKDQEEYWLEQFADMDESEEIEINEYDLSTYKNDLKSAPFDTKDISLIPKMGACGSCPFNTAVNVLLFPDEAKKALCTNSSCFKDKSTISFDMKLNEALQSPEIELVSCSHETNSFVKELIDKGQRVHINNAFNSIDPPDEILLSDFQDDLENENYEDEDEMMREYNKAVVEYQEELNSYNELINSGKLIKAFVVSGRNKGESVFIELIKGKEAKLSSSGLKEKLKNNTVTDADIKAEIKRIKDNEVRKKELEEEKVQPIIYSNFIKDKTFKTKNNPLNNAEKIGFILMLIEFGGYSLQSELFKMAKFKGNSLFTFHTFLTKLENKQLDELQALFSRALIVSKMKPTNTARPSNNALIASFNQIVDSYDQTALSNAWVEQLEERKKREARMEIKISELNLKLKEKKKTEKVELKNVA